MWHSSAIGLLRRGAFIFVAAIVALLIVSCERRTGTEPAPPENINGLANTLPPPAATERPLAAEPTSPPAGAPDAWQPGETTGSLIYNGVERSYVVHVPTGYDPGHPAPLVLAFHGIGLDAAEMMRISGFSDQADQAGFIAVYPNGTGEQKSWNGGHCCGEAVKNAVDDVGFVRTLIDELSSSLAIDPHRIYAAGFSNGAIFVYRLACQLSDRIAAIGPVSATQILNDQEACRPTRNMPVIHFHGMADRLNPYDGGKMASGFEVASVDEAIAFWVGKDACPEQPQHLESEKIIHDVYAPCGQNSAVELYTITDGEHAWPGGEAVSAQVGNPTMEISATPLMWEFFAAHPLP